MIRISLNNEKELVWFTWIISSEWHVNDVIDEDDRDLYKQ